MTDVTTIGIGEPKGLFKAAMALRIEAGLNGAVTCPDGRTFGPDAVTWSAIFGLDFGGLLRLLKASTLSISPFPRSRNLSNACAADATKPGADWLADRRSGEIILNELEDLGCPSSIGGNNVVVVASLTNFKGDDTIRTA